MTKILSLILVSLMLNSCQNKYDTESCDELSMKKFKGIPNAANEFDRNCSDIKITYTQDQCQSALNGLINTQSLEYVKKMYGDKVEGCFTGDDLSRWNKPKVEK